MAENNMKDFFLAAVAKTVLPMVREQFSEIAPEKCEACELNAPSQRHHMFPPYGCMYWQSFDHRQPQLENAILSLDKEEVREFMLKQLSE